MNDSANLVIDFERLWAGGSSPDLGAFLSGVGPLDAEQLSRLARIDQVERWDRGDLAPFHGWNKRPGLKPPPVRGRQTRA